MDVIDEDCADPEDDELWEAVEDMIGLEEKEEETERKKNLVLWYQDKKTEKWNSVLTKGEKQR